ncbi:MAG: SpoIID/LytB domain-containing protein, partial [Christensenellales bacterium]
MRKLAALLLTLALSAAAFLTPLFALPVMAATDYSTIRVRLSASYDDINLGVKGTYLLKETGAIISSDINISLLGNQLVVRSGGTVLFSGTEFTLIRQSGLLRQYNRQHGWRHYLGDMNYKVMPDGLGGYKLAVTNIVGMEDYLIGVAAYEMSNTFPLEALKAQAVAARSYAASKISPSASYDIVDTASDQVYKGYDASLTNVIAAVNATKGQVIVNSAGAVVQAYYCASNGGQTETTQNAWGTALPYFQMKDDPYDLRNPMSPMAKLTLPKVVSEASPLDASLAAFLKSQISPRLSALGYSGFTDTFSIVGCSAAVPYAPKYPAPSRSFTRVKLYLTVSVSGAGSSVAAPQFIPLEGIPDYVLYVNENRLVTLEEKAQIEAAFYASVSAGGAGNAVPIELDIAFSDLSAAGLFTNSSLRVFGVSETATGFDLVNCRYGHGVGMSQRGAQQMANEGLSYLDIINFYYSNVTISQISTVSSTADTVTNPTNPVEFEVALPEPSAVSGRLAAQTAVRAKPSSSASKVVTLKANAVVQIVGHHDGWLLVLTSSGKCGYLPEDAVRLNLDDGVIAMATSDFQLKTDASSAASSVGTVKKGACVQLIATSGSYYLVDASELAGFAPKSALALVVGGIEFATSSDARYGYALSAAPLLKSLS